MSLIPSRGRKHGILYPYRTIQDTSYLVWECSRIKPLLHILLRRTLFASLTANVRGNRPHSCVPKACLSFVAFCLCPPHIDYLRDRIYYSIRNIIYWHVKITLFIRYKSDFVMRFLQREFKTPVKSVACK